MKRINWQQYIALTISHERIMDGESKEPPAGDPPADPPAPRSFSEADVQQMLQQERKKSEENTRRLAIELEEIKKSKNLTAEQKATLESRIEELNNQLLTKEELAKKEFEKAQKESSSKLEQLETERSKWENRFKSTTMLRELTDAASEHSAISPKQIISLLKDDSRIVEVKNDNDEVIGYQTKVRMPSKDKDGKEVVLDLTAVEAVKHMKDNVEQYGNLFKDTNPGGAGMGGGTGSKGKLNPRSMNYEQYKQNRKQFNS